MTCRLATALQLGSNGPLAIKTLNSTSNRRGLVVRAAAGENGQLADLKRKLRASLPEVEEQVATKPPRFTTASRSSGWNANPQTDQMRRHERQALDAWTNGGMMQLAAGGTMVLVLLLLFAAGGPPSDARCTLPWC